MKLQTKDKVIVITGRDKGKTGEVVQVLPAKNMVVVTGINIMKRHTKPSAQNPKGGIVELTKPVLASKLMAVDPKSGRPARIGYQLDKNGNKQRVYKVSKFSNPKKVSKPTATKKAKEVTK